MIIASAEAAYTRRERGLILVFAFLGTVFDGADYTIFLYFMAPIATYLHVSLLDVSYIQASSYIVGIVGGVLFGSIADRWGRRLGLAATIAMYSIFTILTAFITDYTTLLIVRTLAGIGIGGESGIAFAYVNEAFPARGSRRGLVSSLLQTMFLVGTSVAILTYSATSTHYGPDAWRWAFGYLGLGAVLAAAVRGLMPESRIWLASRRAAAETVGGVARRGLLLVEIFRHGLAKRVIIATLMMAFGFYSSYAVLTYAPAMWQTVYKLPPGVVGQIGVIGTVAGAASYVVGGILADAKGRRWSFAFTAWTGVVGYVAFLLAILGLLGSNDVGAAAVWTAPIVLAFILIQLGHGYYGVQGVWLSELFPTHLRTTAQNFVYYVSRAIGGGLAPILGLLAARGLGLGVQFAVAFGIVGGAGAALFCLYLPETRGEALRGD
jgi:MFS family permease